MFRLLRCIETKVRHTPEVEECTLPDMHQSQQDVSAKRTSRDEAGTLRVQMCFCKPSLCSAIAALALCARNIHRKNSAQFTCSSITVQVVHRWIHFRSPVAPKRSVLI